MRWVWVVTVLLLAGQVWAFERLPCGDVVHIRAGEVKEIAWDLPVPGENVTHTLLTWIEFIHDVRYPDITVEIPIDPPPPDLPVTKVIYAGAPPRTGSFYIEVRFVNGDGVIGGPTITSMQDLPEQVPDPWCYLVTPAPPGGGVIE